MIIFATILAILIDLSLIVLTILAFAINYLFGTVVAIAVIYLIILSIVILVNIFGED
jgi:hypothetical protein